MPAASAVETLEKLRFPELALSAYFPTDPGAGRNYYRALLEDLIKADFHKAGRHRASGADTRDAHRARRAGEAPVRVPSGGGVLVPAAGAPSLLEARRATRRPDRGREAARPGAHPAAAL